MSTALTALWHGKEEHVFPNLPKVSQTARYYLYGEMNGT